MPKSWPTALSASSLRATNRSFEIAVLGDQHGNVTFWQAKDLSRFRDTGNSIYSQVHPSSSTHWPIAPVPRCVL